MLAAALVFSYDIPNYQKFSGLENTLIIMDQKSRQSLAVLKRNHSWIVVKAVKTDSTQDY